VFCDVKDLTLISPSQWLADLTRQSFLKDYPVIVVRNKIDLDSFYPRQSDFKIDHHIEGKFMFLCVGFSWDSWKTKDIIRISNMLEKDEVLVIVGVDDNLRRLLNRKTIMIRRTNSKDELARIYSAADVFINPTYSDNYPTVNIEAEACGTPVICYNTGGSKETIALKNSICVPKGNLELLLLQSRRLKTPN
jgi:glycosyltransferase involved in cell wall biosynthesis